MGCVFGKKLLGAKMQANEAPAHTPLAGEGVTMLLMVEMNVNALKASRNA